MAVDVSFLIAVKNVAAYLPAALQCALDQRNIALEAVVVDDGSSDGSQDIAQRFASRDDRVRLVRNEGAGISAARNTGLAHARGDWIAILDADDLIHPDRSARLLKLAGGGYEIVADNLLLFVEERPDLPPKPLIAHARWSTPRAIAIGAYLRSTFGNSETPPLGVLKPMLRRDFIEANRLRYDLRLRIGEDQDFCARALAAGARFGYLPQSLYCYRKHAASLSYRMRETDIAAMIEAETEFGATLAPDLRSLSHKRLHGLARELHVARLVAALKRRDVAGAASAWLADIAMTPRLLRIGSDVVRNRFSKPTPRDPAPSSYREQLAQAFLDGWTPP
jgi:succinoglycan biosynthesis protein ExoO